VGEQHPFGAAVRQVDERADGEVPAAEVDRDVLGDLGRAGPVDVPVPHGDELRPRSQDDLPG
jgi:hypothetical protein